MLGWTIAILVFLIPFQLNTSMKQPKHPWHHFIGGMIGCALIVAPLVWIVEQVFNYFAAGC